MKRILSMLVLLLISFNLSVALGENDFFDSVDEYVRIAIDCSNIEPINLSASHTKPNEYTILVDFREGNNNILLIHDEKCRIYYPVGDDELLSALFRFISSYEEIKNIIPVDGDLIIETFLSNDKRIIVSKGIVDTYYSWTMHYE